MIRKILIFLLLAFFSYAEQNSITKEPLDDQLKETLKVQSRFSSYRTYYDYDQVIEEVRQEFKSSSDEDAKANNKKK